MLIKKMKLHNFKCHKELEIDFSDGITKICGMNGIGKTSIFDAYLWVLFDRNADGVNNPVIRPKNSDGQYEENVEVSVELTMSVDGDEHAIKKTQKKIGNGKGNKNEYEVDGHPMIKREFGEFILKLLSVGEDFDILSDPYALMKMHYTKIREKITSTQDSISDVDIANMYGDKYSLIIPELKNFKTDDILKKHKRVKNDLTEKQNEMKIRIDEASKRIVIADIGALEVEKAAKEAELKKVEDEISGGNSKTEEINSKREEVMSLKFHLSEIQNAENQKLLEDSKVAREKVAVAEKTLADVKHKIAMLSDEINATHSRYESQKTRTERLSAEWKTEKAKAYPALTPLEPLTDDALICPTCGQALPEEVKQKKIADYESRKSEYEVKYEKNKEEFEKRRSENLVRIEKDGKESSALRDELKAKEEELRKQMTEFSKNLVKAQDGLKDFNEELSKYPTVADVSENAEYKATKEKISALEKEIEVMSADTSGRTELEAKKAVLKDEIAEIAGKIMAADNTKVKSDIAEYEKKVEETGQQMADEEHLIDLTEDFVRTKLNMISNNINGLFHLVKWKLFQNLENGSVRETCVCTVNGIDYPEVNAGHKILAGLDIINTFSELCGVRLPIFIDGAGELNSFNLPEMKNQLILLKVTDDKELKVESEDK